MLDFIKRYTACNFTALFSFSGGARESEVLPRMLVGLDMYKHVVVLEPVGKNNTYGYSANNANKQRAITRPL